jgi:hypothetical protein
MTKRTYIEGHDDPVTSASPLATENDYEAAVERLEELEGSSRESCDEERLGEIELLQALVDEFEEREGIMDEADDYVPLRRLPDPETVDLAVFSLSNGNEVRLLGKPDTGELAVVEISDCGVEDFLLDERWSPNAIFRKFAPRDSPVPQMLLRLDSTGAFHGRKTVDAVVEPIAVELAALGAPALQSSGGDLASCWSGATSAAFFQAHHCNTSGGPGYGKSESYCYPNAALWIQKTSKARMRTTYTRAAAGGTSPSMVFHSYKKAGGWPPQFIFVVEPGKVCSHWSALKGVGSWRRRRVRFEAIPIPPGGFVRGWVRYHRQCADGWF